MNMYNADLSDQRFKFVRLCGCLRFIDTPEHYTQFIAAEPADDVGGAHMNITS